MDSSLLATKVRIPPERPHAVQRTRLAEALERGIPQYKLTVLSAPAGYGKSTALAQWARSSDLPVAWLSLGHADSDVERFFRYVLSAWEEAQPGIRESSLGVLLSGMSPDIDAVLSTFVNVADEVPKHTVLVLDGYHLIDEPAIHDGLAFLLDHLPPKFHVVVAGRSEPSLPLARYRARDELFELRASDLNFQLEEAGEFLNRRMGLELSDDEIGRLHGQLEGWVAGLQLVALSLRQRADAVDRLVVSGRHRFIAGYLSEEVLDHLSKDIEQVLLRTSILDRLCGPLCDDVTGRNDGQEMLELLERENLFVVSLDERQEWFRFHPLFADVLHEILNRRHPDDIAALHRRAASWYFTRDLPDEAFDHAVAGDDPDLVSRIFERHVNVKLNCGELRDVARWLDSLPSEWYSTHPLLGLARAGLLAFSGALEECLRWIDDVERRLGYLETEDTGWQLAMTTAVRCFIACMQNDLARAEMYADKALRDLREESRSFRATIYLALGDTYRRNGHWEEAQACYMIVPDTVDAPGFQVQAAVQSAHVFGALADLELRQGRLQRAAGYWGKALAAIQEPESWGRLELPVTGWVYIRTGEVLYEWNDLPVAWNHLLHGFERAELGGDVRTMIAGNVLAARVSLTEGDVDAAGGYLERARPLVEQAPFPEWSSRFERVQLELWLAQGKLRAAVNWADEMLLDEALRERPEPEMSRLALARALIYKGDVTAIEAALALLRDVIQTAENEGRMGVQIESLALQSLANWQRGDRTDAMTSLERALRLAEPEGYIRLFADLGLPMVRLLQEARSRDVLPDYVATLLAACGPESTLPDAAGGALPEPLTSREQEVLELLAAGLTNPEIGDRLMISPQTVKKHAGNIYGKLGVRSRTEAASRARELNLLN